MGSISSISSLINIQISINISISIHIDISFHVGTNICVNISIATVYGSLGNKKCNRAYCSLRGQEQDGLQALHPPLSGGSCSSGQSEQCGS